MQPSQPPYSAATAVQGAPRPQNPQQQPRPNAGAPGTARPPTTVAGASPFARPQQPMMRPPSAGAGGQPQQLQRPQSTSIGALYQQPMIRPPANAGQPLQQQQQQQPPQNRPPQSRPISGPNAPQQRVPPVSAAFPPAATANGSPSPASLARPPNPTPNQALNGASQAPVRRSSPSPTPAASASPPAPTASAPPPSAASTAAAPSAPSFSGPPGTRPIPTEDDIPLEAEVFENQRYYPMVGWTAKMLDRPAFSNEEGTKEVDKDQFKCPPGWSWDGDWQVEIDTDGRWTDDEGWSYASEFGKRFRGSADPTIKAVRRRRHFRRRLPPPKSVRAALGLNNAKANSLTIGYFKNPLALAVINSNTVRAAASGGSGSNTLTARLTLAGASGANQATQKSGATPSLSELYARRVEYNPATAAATATTTSAAAGAQSPPSAAEQSVSPPAPTAPEGVSPSAYAWIAKGAQIAAAREAAAKAAAEAAANGGNAATSTATVDATATSLLEPETDAEDDLSDMRPKFVPFAHIAELSGRGSSRGSEGVNAAPVAPRKVMVRIYEFQRYWPFDGWKHRMLPTDNKGQGSWINDIDNKKCPPKDEFQLDKEWRWSMDAWAPLIDTHTDAEGWSYAVDPSMKFHPLKSMEHFVRRRLWQREKVERDSNSVAGAAVKSYTVFFERLERFKEDLKLEEKDDDLVSLKCAAW